MSKSYLATFASGMSEAYLANMFPFSHSYRSHGLICVLVFFDPQLLYSIELGLHEEGFYKNWFKMYIL